MIILSNSFAQEFNIDDRVRHKINDIYRQSKKQILEYLAMTNSFMPEIDNIINKRSHAIQKQIIILDEKIKNKYHRNTLLIQYIHMMVNRFFMSKNREYELLSNQ